MAFDIIVFSQKELENALNSGITSIGLCDNTFILPNKGGIYYIAIGTVEVSVNAAKEEFVGMNIKCDGFEPLVGKLTSGKKTEKRLVKLVYWN